MNLDEENYDRLLQVAGLAIEQLEIILRLVDTGELNSISPALDDAAHVVKHSQNMLRLCATDAA
jgi:hypothetical protein